MSGRQICIGLGSYPDVPLKRSREKRHAERRRLAGGTYTAEARRQAELAEKDPSADFAVLHDFRSMAASLLHDTAFVSSDIEPQLAHADKNQIRGTYNHPQGLKERVKMIQQWSDFPGLLPTMQFYSHVEMQHKRREHASVRSIQPLAVHDVPCDAPRLSAGALAWP